MSALGFMLVGFGLLTAWSALLKVNVFDTLRSILGGTPPARNPVTGGRLPPGQSRG